MMLLLLPLLRPQKGRQRRASPLLLSAALLCVLPASTGLPVGHKCPPHCKREGRNCSRDSSHCGRCFFSLVENKEGRCVRRLRPHGQSASFTDPDEEIDLLQAAFVKEEVTKEVQALTNPAVLPQTDQNSRSGSSLHALKSKSHDPQHAKATTPLPETSTHKPTEAVILGGPRIAPTLKKDQVLIIIISLCVVVGAVAVVMATVCFFESQKGSRLTQKVDYPSFGGVGSPTGTATSMGDKTLAQNAQMYHYQHRKQQMLSVGHHKQEQNTREPEMTSDEEEVGGDFTVYECPGLAPTGEMEVKNPLFDDSNLHYQGNHK